MGRYSVTVSRLVSSNLLLLKRYQESALVQGASVRLKEDIPDMEGLLLRWLVFVSAIDMVGVENRGEFWALAPTSAASAPTAYLAVQPLAVFEVQLPEDIDDLENETREEEMKEAGYRGNNNRRAIPIVVVRYATAVPSLGSQKVRCSEFRNRIPETDYFHQNVKSLIDFGQLTMSKPANAYLTPTQLMMFSRVL